MSNNVYNFEQERILGQYSLDKLKREKFFQLTTSYSKEELDSLKYISEDAVIIITFFNYQTILNIIEILKKYNKKNQIKINIKADNDYEITIDCVKNINKQYENSSFFIDVIKQEKNDFNKIVMNHLEEVINLPITINDFVNGNIELKQYINFEKRLYNMVEPAQDFSPFERYLYAYNIVKKFKPYKDNPNNMDDSRNLYKIIDNEYIVCEGYSKLLGDLLDKLSIPNLSYDVKIDHTFDNIPTDTFTVTSDMLKDSNKTRHARRIVHLIDEKYGINGYFFADPTWDNIMDNDAYNYALLIPDEYNGIKYYNYLSFKDTKEMFFVHSLEEFYKKANIWMDKNKLKNSESRFISMFLQDIKVLDNQYFLNLSEKYPQIKEKFYNYTKEEVQNIMFDLGNYIVSKVNKPVTGLQLKKGIMFLYQNCYGVKNDNELEILIDEILNYNKKRQSFSFPIRIKQNSLDIFTLYQNTENKFEFIKESKNKKS